MTSKDNIAPHTVSRRDENTPVAENAGQPPKPGANNKEPRVNNPNSGPNGKRMQQGNLAGAPLITILPLAEIAGVRSRHRALFFSFFAFVLLPIVAAVVYLWAISADQYASTVGFTVRQEEGASASDLIGGLAKFTGGSTSSDTDILYEFIQSQEIVQAIDAHIDLVGIYSQNWPGDPLFSLWPTASREDLLWYWLRMVRISFDQSTGLIELRVLAFSPDAAQLVATEIVTESQSMINALNTTAREDVTRYAREDLEKAVARLKIAREALTRFRTRTQIVDPSADIQGRMGVLNNLQQQLAQSLIDSDILQETTNSSDPRLAQSQRRIEVIRARIADERRNFATASTEIGSLAEDYPSLIAEYESLTVDREFAEETYRAALAAVDLAQANASRQSRYLAAYIRPTLPETSEFPQRYVLVGLLALFLTLSWSIMALVYYSIRDRR